MKNKGATSFLYFLRFFSQYKLLVFLTIVSLIIARAGSTADPVILRDIIDAVTRNEIFQVIASLLILYFGVRLGSILFEFLRDYLAAPVIMGVSRDIELAVFDQLLTLPVSYHADQRAGAAARALARGSRAITFVLDFSISQILPPMFELLFVTLLLLRLYTWHYAVITLSTIIVYTWFTIWSTEKRQKFRIEGNVRDDTASGVLVDSVSNIETVKYFNNEAMQFQLFGKIKQEWSKLLVKSNRLFAVVYGTQGLILLAGLGLILVLAVRQSTGGLITVGDLVLLTTYIVRLSVPITTLGFVYGQFKNSFADLDAMALILSQEVSVTEPKRPKTIPQPKGKIEFRKVNFDYPSRKGILSDLTFVVEPGQNVAFVGHSGSGKSTIAKLLFRLYDVKSGAILIDGVNVKDLSATSRRKLLSIVPQEPILFNDPIATNIRFGKPDAELQEIKKVAAIAGIGHFIENLPNQYETLVGERGVKLSGGEKQRVAIARALIRDPQIIVFDEATSSLDSKTEKAIQSALQKAASGRTAIAIAHRLSTVIDSDTIYVLDHGRIVEQGTHRQLQEQKGTYAKLWEIQSKHREG